MTQPNPEATLTQLTRTQITFQHYHGLLNEIQRLGIEHFAVMIDESTEDELTDLLTAANVVRARIQSYRTKKGI
jgi:hypothetical protein